MLTQMYLCVAVFTVAFIFYLFAQKIDQFITMRVHLNLMHQRIKPKIPGRLVHSLFLGERSELLLQCRQQTRVFAWSCSQ